MRALAWLLVAGGAILGADAQIRVMSPPHLVHDLQDNGRIPGSTATFGAPQLGESMLGRLVYGESRGLDHCSDEDYSLPEEGNPFTGELQLDSIVVVRRGMCSYTQKVQVAIRKGAHAVVVVDRKSTGLTHDGLQNFILSDDGQGANISIPTVLITNKDGETLIKHLLLASWDGTRQEEVVVEMSWDSSPSSGIATVDSWMSAGSKESMKFIKEFAPKRRLLNGVIQFTPRFNVFPVEPGDPEVFKQLCWDEKNGTYCTEVPDGFITGREVLEEDIRMLCIHEVYQSKARANRHAGHHQQYPKEFWDYVERFASRCPMSSFLFKKAEARFGVQCSTLLMKEVGIDVKAIHECARHTANEKLEEQLYNRAWGSRAVRINGARYKGVLDAHQVVTEICRGFTEQPVQCSQLISPGDALWSARVHQGGIADQRDPHSAHPQNQPRLTARQDALRTSQRRHHHVMSWARKEEALELWLFFMLLFFMSMASVGAAFSLYKCYLKRDRQARDVTVPQEESVQDTEFARLD